MLNDFVRDIVIFVVAAIVMVAAVAYIFGALFSA